VRELEIRGLARIFALQEIARPASANNRDAAATPERGAHASGIIGKATDIGQGGIPGIDLQFFPRVPESQAWPRTPSPRRAEDRSFPRDPDSALHRLIRASRDGSRTVVHVRTTPGIDPYTHPPGHGISSASHIGSAEGQALAETMQAVTSEREK